MNRSLLAVIGVILVSTCAPRAAQALGDNLVANGSFDTNLSGWTSSPSSSSTTHGTEWSDEDAAGAVDSGSAVIHAAGVSGSSLTSACVLIDGGSDYALAGAYKFESNFAWSSALRIFVLWHADAACSGSSLGQEILATEHFNKSGSWTAASRVVTAPAGAVAARIVLRVNGDYEMSRTVVTGHFDDIVLAPVVCGSGCGDPVPDAGQGSGAEGALVTSTDALYLLQAAIGEQTCTPCICDVDASGGVNATDALLVLTSATGAPVALVCPE